MAAMILLSMLGISVCQIGYQHFKPSAPAGASDLYVQSVSVLNGLCTLSTGQVKTFWEGVLFPFVLCCTTQHSG
jgi:hypothetical protein